MFVQYQAIRDFDLYESEEQPLRVFPSLVFRKDQFAAQTQDNQLEEESRVLQMEKTKAKQVQIQTSFHKKIMDQHILSFEKNFSQYLEKSFPRLKTSQKQSFAEQIFGQDLNGSNSCQKLTEILVRDHAYFEQKQKNRFLKELFYEQNLYEFLSWVCEVSHSQIALELVYVASQFCQLYVQSEVRDISQTQMEQLVEKSMKTAHFSEKLRKLQFLGMKRSRMPVQIPQKELEENLKRLIRIFGVTVIMVMEEYFVNPFVKQEYTSTESIRRPFNFMDISNDEYSENEEDFHFAYEKGNKKRKSI